MLLITLFELFLAQLDTAVFATDYRLTISEAGQVPMTLNGTLTMRGELFTANIFGSQIAYDGETLYYYDEETNELTLSKPTRTDLEQSNPLLYARTLYHTRDVRVRMDEHTHMPVEAEMKEGTKTLKLVFLKPKFIPTAPAFTLTKEGAYVNDLR